MKIALSLLTALLAAPVTRAGVVPPPDPASTYKQYAQIYCGKDAVDEECQAKYAESYGPFMSRVAEVCKAEGTGWLKEFGERCEVLLTRTDGAAPSLRTAEQWAEAGKPARYDALLAQEANDLNAHQRGYDAALRLNETLKNEYLPKKDFEGALKRRTERMLPDYGTKKDNKLRAINVIYVYLGAEAKDFLVGADGKSGKLGFLNDLGKVKDATKLRDEDKYLSESARKTLADQKTAAAQGDKGREQAKKMAEELKKGLKQQVEGFAKGAASEGDAPVAAGAAAPFWSGAPRSAERSLIAASQKNGRQLRKELTEKSPEPPAVAGDKPEKKRKTFEGCHSFLGIKCAIRAVEIAFDEVVSRGKDVVRFVKRESKEAVMMGPKTKEQQAADAAAKAARKAGAPVGPADPVDPANPVDPAAPAPVDQAAELASIQRWTREAIQLADQASVIARSAAARAVKAAAGKDPDAVAAQAAASAEGEEALKHAADAKEKALAAIAAVPPTAGTEAKNFANTSAMRAKVAADRALGFAVAAEAAAARQAAASAAKAAVETVKSDWGQELKSAGGIIEVAWTAGKGSYLKVINKNERSLKTTATAYIIPDGTSYEWSAGDGKRHCATVKGRDVLVLRRATGLSTVTLDATLCPGQTAAVSGEDATRAAIIAGAKK